MNGFSVYQSALTYNNIGRITQKSETVSGFEGSQFNLFAYLGSDPIAQRDRMGR